MEDNRVSPYPLRLDPKLRDKLQMKANKNGIPLSQEILNALDQSSRDPSTAEQLEEKISDIDFRLSNIEKQQETIIQLIKNLSPS